MKDPYEAQGKDFRVHHPTQPKTQVERWREEITENMIAINKHCPSGDLCTDCLKRVAKEEELCGLIDKDHEKNKRYLNRYPTGTFADDETTLEHIGKANDMGTLLDKIKKLLWKRL